MHHNEYPLISSHKTVICIAKKNICFLIQLKTIAISKLINGCKILLKLQKQRLKKGLAVFSSNESI